MTTLASESVVEFAFMPAGRLHETVRFRQHTGIIIIAQLSSAYIILNILRVNFILCKLFITGSRVSTAEAYMQCERMFSLAIFPPCLDPRKEVLKHPFVCRWILYSLGYKGLILSVLLASFTDNQYFQALSCFDLWFYKCMEGNQFIAHNHGRLFDFFPTHRREHD